MASANETLDGLDTPSCGDLRPLVTGHRAFLDLLDHPSLLPYLLALVGGNLQLAFSTATVIPPGAGPMCWHEDGPRPWPYPAVGHRRAQIFVRIGDCAEAARWADAARADAHPEVEDALARAEAGVLECEAALVAAAPPPEPTPEPMAPTSEPAAAAAASDSGVTTRSDVVRPDLVEAGPGRDRSGRVGWSLVGAGVALGGAALAIDAVGASDRNTIDRLACGETLCADPADRAVYSAADSAENRRLVPIVLLGTVGLGAGVTGIVKLARRGRESDTADVSLRWTGTGVGARVGW